MSLLIVFIFLQLLPISSTVCLTLILCSPLIFFEIFQSVSLCHHSRILRVHLRSSYLALWPTHHHFIFSTTYMMFLTFILRCISRCLILIFLVYFVPLFVLSFLISSNCLASRLSRLSCLAESGQNNESLYVLFMSSCLWQIFAKRFCFFVFWISRRCISLYDM